jgi:hypothetical protein
MMNRLIENNWLRINAIFFIWMFISILMTANTLLHQADAWLVGDWLINYQGGFVRRGLSGEVLLKISSLTKIDLIALTIFIQIALCLCTFIFTFKLTRHIRPTAINAVIVFSPAFVRFMPWGLDGFRKEMLLFALLSFHSYYLSRTKNEVKNEYLVLLSLLLVFIVLSHEMLAAFLPYFICGLYLQSNKLNRSNLLKYTMLVTPAILIAAMVIFLFRGNSEIVAGICSSLLQNAPLDCQTARPAIDGYLNIGAISFLAKDFEFGRQAVANGNPPIGLITNGIVLILAMAPVLYLFKKYEILKSNRYLLVFPFISVMATLPLMFVVADYGRLICIHAICLTYVALQMLNTREETYAKSHDAGVYVWLLCLVFILGWRVIGYGASPGKVFTPLRIYREVSNVNSLTSVRHASWHAESTGKHPIFAARRS